MGGKAHHPSSSESDYWGDESWIVDCPCGVNFDDGEEMVECDECAVWVHTTCCRVPKGLTTYMCDKCKSKKKKEFDEVRAEVSIVAAAPSADPHSGSPHDIHASDPVRKSHEVPISDRVHVQGPPGGDALMFSEVSKVFSQQLWRFTGYVPKAFHPKCNDIPAWFPEEDMLERLLSIMPPEKEVSLTNKEGGKITDRSSDEDLGNPRKVITVSVHVDKHGKRDTKKVEGKHIKLGHKSSRANRDAKVQMHMKRGSEDGIRKDLSNKRMKVGNSLKAEEDVSKEDEVSRSEADPTLGKSPVFPTKNPKAMKKMAVQEFMDGHVSLFGRCTHSEQNAN